MPTKTENFATVIKHLGETLQALSVIASLQDDSEQTYNDTIHSDKGLNFFMEIYHAYIGKIITRSLIF